MKVIGDENNLTIYINKDLLKINYNDEIDEIEKKFRNIFFKIKEIYNINLNGFYLTNAYIDDSFGIIIDMKREELDYYNDFEIEMQLSINNINFLYEVDDIFFQKEILKNTNIYLYKNKYYIKINDDSIIDKVIEHIIIIYKNTENILKYGKLLKIL